MQRWKKNFYLWEAAPFFRLLLPFTGGIFCYDWLGMLRLPSYVFIASVLTLSVVQLLFKIRHIIRSMTIYAALFLTGYYGAFTADIRNDASWFGKVLSADAYVVRIIKAPQMKERTWKLQVSVEKAISGFHFSAVKGKAFIYVYKDSGNIPYSIGDQLVIPSSWQPLKNPGNPFEFDHARFCRRNNIYYQQFVGRNEVVRLSGDKMYQLSLADRTHAWAMRQLDFFVEDKSTLGLLQAMLLGDEINFSDEDRQLYVDTGIIHVVAISGGHIAFLMLLITTLLFWIRKEQHQWIKMAVALPAVMFYVMVAGAPPSAVRAAVVFGLLGISTFLKKDNNPLNTLFATAFAILFVQPMWLFSVGFQLSFVAVLSLILFYKKIFLLYYPPNIIAGFLWRTIAASLAAEILVAPLVIYYFHLLPAAFLLANVVAAVLMSIVMILGLAILGFCWLPTASGFLANLTVQLVKGFQTVINALRSLNPESFHYLHLAVFELLICYLIISAVAIYTSEKNRVTLQISLAGLCLLLASFIFRQWHLREQIVIYNIPGHAYTEYISDHGYSILSESSDSIPTKKIDYASRENHVKQRAWKQVPFVKTAAIRFDGRSILFLKSPIESDGVPFEMIDYLVLEYPLRHLDIQSLTSAFSFKKLIVTGQQKRKAVQQWKDSCMKCAIDAHFTMLDGAYIINPRQ